MGDPSSLKPLQFLDFASPFHIFVVGEHRDFKVDVHVTHSKSRSTEDKLSLKGGGSGHIT